MNQNQSVDLMDVRDDRHLFQIVRLERQSKIGPVANMVPTNDGRFVCLTDVLGNVEVWDIKGQRQVFAKNIPQFKSGTRG